MAWQLGNGIVAGATEMARADSLALRIGQAKIKISFSSSHLRGPLTVGFCSRRAPVEAVQTRMFPLSPCHSHQLSFAHTCSVLSSPLSGLRDPCGCLSHPHPYGGPAWPSPWPPRLVQGLSFMERGLLGAQRLQLCSSLQGPRYQLVPAASVRHIFRPLA